MQVFQEKNRKFNRTAICNWGGAFNICNNTSTKF